jgi:FkbM family methyltransferase
MAAIKYLLGQFGKFLRNYLRIKIPQNIYKSMGFYGEFIFEANGTEVTLHNFRDEISNDIFYSGIYGNYEGHSLELWNNLCLQAQDSIVMDIGAFSGVYSLVAANANPKIDIYSFEPHPNTFKMLKKNTQSNNFKNIYLNNYALSDYDGEIKFYNSKGDAPSGFSAVNHRFIEKDAGTKICIARDVLSILNSELSMKRISLIKIDIERGELPLLRIMIDRIVKDKTIVLSEILDEEFYEDFDTLFHQNGFQSIKINDSNHSTEIVASLGGTRRIGRNVLFIPAEINLLSLNINDERI